VPDALALRELCSLKCAGVKVWASEDEESNPLPTEAYQLRRRRSAYVPALRNRVPSASAHAAASSSSVSPRAGPSGASRATR